MKTYKEILGRKGWDFLHTMAEGWNNISIEGREDLRKFWKYLAKSYPCKECSVHMTKYLSDYPVKTSSNLNYRKWLSDFHNDVNKRLGKKIYKFKP
jgi:hypothetical protein